MEQQESAALARVLALLGQPFRTLAPSPPRSCGCPWTCFLASRPGAGLGSLVIFLGLVCCFVRPGWESLGLR